MAIRIREVSGISILDIEGRIDINSSDIIETVGWLVNTGKINIVFSLENVDLVDYNGLSIIAIAYKNIINHKGKLRLLRVPLSVVELLKVVKLDAVFEIYDIEEDAVNSFFNQDVNKLPLRRKFQRLDIHFDVKYTLSGAQKKPNVFSGKAMNISAAGLYIYTPYTFPLNSLVELEFRLPGTSGPLICPGRVVWLSDKEIQPHSYPGMGVSFSHLNVDLEKVIADFIEKNTVHRADTL